MAHFDPETLALLFSPIDLLNQKKCDNIETTVKAANILANLGGEMTVLNNLTPKTPKTRTSAPEQINHGCFMHISLKNRSNSEVSA